MQDLTWCHLFGQIRQFGLQLEDSAGCGWAGGQHVSRSVQPDQ